MHELAKLSSRNQAQVPAGVRRALGLRPGDRMVFEVDSRGESPTVTLRRFATLDELSGSVPNPPDVAELDWSEVRARAWTPSTRVRRRRADH